MTTLINVSTRAITNGLKNPNMPNLAATDSTVFAATNEGKLYRGTWQK